MNLDTGQEQLQVIGRSYALTEGIYHDHCNRLLDTRNDYSQDPCTIATPDASLW